VPKSRDMVEDGEAWDIAGVNLHLDERRTGQMERSKGPVLTHALHYGTGVFEGIRCFKTSKGPAIFRLKDHVARMFESAKIYLMKMPYSPSEIEDAVKTTVSTNKLKECYLRPLRTMAPERWD